MKNKIITEDKVREIINEILSEETSKVSRQEYSRLLFKIEEFETSLNDTIREFRQMESVIPEGLKTLTGGRIKSMAVYLSSLQKLTPPLKDRVLQHKKRASAKVVVDKGADVSSFGDPFDWQRSTREDRDLPR